MAVERLLQPLLVEEVADEAHRSTQHEHAIEAAVGDQLIRLKIERTEARQGGNEETKNMHSNSLRPSSEHASLPNGCVLTKSRKRNESLTSS